MGGRAREKEGEGDIKKDLAKTLLVISSQKSLLILNLYLRPSETSSKVDDVFIMEKHDHY